MATDDSESFAIDGELRDAQLPFLRDLRRSVAPELQKMSKLQPHRTYLAIAFDYLLIAGAIALGEIWPAPLTYFAAVLLIAGRQHALLGITHEGVHYRISAHHRWNDLVSDWLAAFPIFFDTEAYRQSHMKHHRHLNTDDDPDWVRKVGQPQWSFPVTPAYIAKSAPRFALWTGWRDWLGFSLPMTGLSPWRSVLNFTQLRRLAKRAPFYLVAFGLIGHFQLWAEFALYWLVPFFFVFPTFQRIRSVAEHFALKYTHELNSTRNVHASWFERLFFGPHQLGYHLTHHLFPSVPFYRLPDFNQILEQDPGYRRQAHQNSAYITPRKGSMVRDLLGKTDAETTAQSAA
jgi:fatty acid desaturase